jgi:CDP-4-dehydro-6-deoxyglucose reductase, E3
MSFNIELQASGEKFVCSPSQSLLESGLKAGIAMPFSCRSGMCMTCRGHIVQGEVDYGGAHEKYLPLEDRAKGYALLCCAKPLSDLLISVPKSNENWSSQRYPMRILDLKKVASDVIVLTLGTPPNQPVQFRAGQFIDILLADGVRRSYSIANAPKAQGVRQIELHIRHLPGGKFTDRLFSTAKTREMLQVEMPLGSFYWRADNPLPMVMLASGTGFAPIKSILLDLVEKKSNASIHLYWGGRRKQDLYEFEFAQSLGSSLPHFKFIPVLSDAMPEDVWAGRTGFVHKAVLADFSDLSGCQVYACGAPVVIESARKDFAAICGLKSDNFYADSFISEAEKSQI